MAGLLAQQPTRGQDRPAGCWPHGHMPKQRWTIIQPEWRYSVISTMCPPAVVAGLRNRISLPIVAPQVHHNAGWTPVPYTGRNFMRKFLPHEDSNQSAFRNTSPRQGALDHDAMARDTYIHTYKGYFSNTAKESAKVPHSPCALFRARKARRRVRCIRRIGVRRAVNLSESVTVAVSRRVRCIRRIGVRRAVKLSESVTMQYPDECDVSGGSEFDVQ
ncbi:hypothetical protein ANN_24289 [Periplaneta americana]|uniref:Uncharacterized protein n=1 Tax=Periplaneta americana TaxID=6978 RepID=A0ABQ8S306_PERAM|nr:hypothetical protein ANN_24289 [Periplaneta americana]